MKTIIASDSTVDLPASYIIEHNLPLIDLSYTLKGQERLDRNNTAKTYRDFYNALREGEMSVTSQVNSQRMSEFFRSLLAGNDMPLIYVAFSSALSGTYNSACVAQRDLESEFPGRIHVIDSRCASLGEGLLVHYALKMRDEDRTAEEIIDWLENNKLKLNHWFTVDDLHFLRRGGRISGVAALMGSILSIKPVMHVNDLGQLIPMEKKKGRRNAIKALVDHMAQLGVNLKEQIIFISHGDCEEDANYLADIIRSRFGVKEFIINFVGPVIGSHSGPGTLALFFMGTSRG